MFCSPSSAQNGTLTPLWLVPSVSLVRQLAPRAGEDGVSLGEDTAKNNYEVQTNWTKTWKTSEETIRRGPNRTVKG